MDPADIAALFYGDEATGPEKAQQLAAALRGDTQLGQLGMLTGDKVLGGVGQSLVQGAQQGQQQLEKAANMRLTRAMQAEQQKTEQAFRQAQEAHMQKQEAFEGQRLAQDNAPKFIQGNGYSPAVIFDPRKKSAQVVPGLEAGGAGAGDAGPHLTANQEALQWNKLMDAVSTVRGRSSLLPKYQARIDQAQQLGALLQKPNGELVEATPQQVREAGTSLAKLVGAGTLSEKQIEELTPDTLKSRWANVKQLVLNTPESAEAQDFLKNMLETADRETITAKKQMRAGQLQGIPGNAWLRKRDAKRFEGILKGAGIDPSSIDEQGLEIVKQAAAAAGGGATGGGGLSPADQKAVDWAKKNPTNPDAQNILKLHHMAP